MRRCAIVVGLFGCQHAAELPKPKPLEIKSAALTITDGEFARGHAKSTKHTSLPFAFEPTGVNGTQLMMQFLGYAEAHGARYASDLSITVQMTHDNATIECVTKVVLDDNKRAGQIAEAAPAAPEPDEYTTTVRPWQPAQVHAQVDEHDFVCEKHARQVIVQETIVADRNDAEVKRYMAPGSNRVVSKPKIEWYDDCRLEARHREVTRWEHFIAAHFEPPDWSVLAHAYAEGKLIELPPECHQIATPEHMVQRVDGDLSYLGPLGQSRVDDPTPVPALPWTRVRIR